MGGDSSHAVTPRAIIHCTLQCSFTLTLYSLDVVTVNTRASFLGETGTCVVGVSSSSRVHTVRSARHKRSRPMKGPHHTDKLLTVWSSLLFFSQPPLSFSRGGKYLFRFGFVPCPSLSLSPPPSYINWDSSLLLLLILCLIICIFLNTTYFSLLSSTWQRTTQCKQLFPG